jgi:hypothetical protein
MADKSGIEMLEMILARLDFLEKKIDVLDQNVKKIANSAKMAEMINKAAGTPVEKFAKANAPKIQPVENQAKQAASNNGMRFKFEPTDASKVKQAAVATPAKRTPQAVHNVVVKGKMVTVAGDKSVPLTEVAVKIYNAKDALVKETKTNRAGQWVSHLPPGKYVAAMSGLFNGQELIPQNINFEIPEGVTEFEVR